MARNLAALRAALGGLAGAAAGFSAQKAAEEERKRIDTETKRREALDLATLQASGWMAPEQRTQRLQAASPALQSAFSTAASIMGGGTGGASLAAPPTKEQQQSLTGAAGLLREPAGRITIGGQDMVLPETPMQRQERLDLAEENRKKQELARLRQEKDVERERLVSSLVTAGVPRDKAVAGVNAGASYGDFFPRTTERAPRRQLNERTGQIVDLDTGEVIQAKGYTIPPKEQRQERASDSMALRKEFDALTKSVRTVNAQAERLNALANKTQTTPQEDQAIVYAFNKMQDESVVRESEYRMTESAAALTDRARNLARRVLEGNKLTQQQRKDMVAAANTIRDSMMGLYSEQADSYENMAREFGLNPRHVVPVRLDRRRDDAGATEPTREDRIRSWKAQNPRAQGETTDAYVQRMKKAGL